MTEEERQKESNKLQRAYREVFGSDMKRTEAQRRVIADIEREGRIWSNIWIPTPSGDLNPHRAAIAEGQRIFAIRIIQMANSKPGEEKEKVTVKKG